MKKILTIKFNRNYIFNVFFIFMIVFSVLIYKDFGISNDEEPQYSHLKVTARKIYSTLGVLDRAPVSVKTAQDINDYQFKYYGVSAQLPLLVLEYFPDTYSPQTANFYYARHLYIRMFFIISGFFLYLILKDIIKSDFLLLLSLVLYFFHPRISAHSFYNIKDSLFLSFFTISTYFLFRWIRSHKIKDLLFFATITAFTVNIRMMGLILPLFFYLKSFLNLKKNCKYTLRDTLIFSVVLVVTLYLIWPALWGNPLKVFLEGFKTFSNFQEWDDVILFRGKWVRGQQLPTSYIPMWLFVTTPIAHLVVFIAGFVFFLPNILAKKVDEYVFNLLLFSFISIIVSYGAIIFFNSTLYGDWRHLYYIFTPLLLLGTLGLNFLLNFNSKVFYVLFALVLSCFIVYVFWMRENHPHYYVYFNNLAGKNWDENWDKDISRLSSKQLLEKFFKKVGVCVPDQKYLFLEHYSVRINTNLLPLEKRNCLNFTNDLNSALYFVEDYRYPLEKSKYVGFEEFVNVQISGKKVMSIFKRK